MKFTNTVAAELFWVFCHNEGVNKQENKKTPIIKGILK